MSDASQITRRAKSNLAFALGILPRDRREDMVLFYAFCRTLDDLADSPGLPVERRAAELARWENGLRCGFEDPDPLQRQVIDLRERRKIPNELLLAIAAGCQSDLQPRRFRDWEELSDYIWKVACAVGLVSVRIFGCTDPGADDYAVALGRALQLTNILRDLREDYENGGRIYLPLDELERSGYSEPELTKFTYNPSFLALMDHQATRAEGYFREADSVLPPGDFRALAPARIMGGIYRELLAEMRRGGFRVFEKRHRISTPRKTFILLKHLIARRP